MKTPENPTKCVAAVALSIGRFLGGVSLVAAPKPDSSYAPIQPAPMSRQGAIDHSQDMSSLPASIGVFIADDADLLRARVAALLGASAMRVVGEAASPQDCIEGILNARPQVVVLDVQLAGGTGLQVLRAVRAAAPEIAFVVFSNSADPVYRQRYLREGANDFLDKSTEFDQLARAVANASQRGARRVDPAQ